MTNGLEATRSVSTLGHKIEERVVPNHDRTKQNSISVCSRKTFLISSPNLVDLLVDMSLEFTVHYSGTSLKRSRCD